MAPVINPDATINDRVLFSACDLELMLGVFLFHNSTGTEQTECDFRKLVEPRKEGDLQRLIL